MQTKSATEKGFLVLLGFLVAVTTAWSEPKEIASSLTLDQVIAEALQNNPQVRQMQAKWEAALERPAQERALPNPMLAIKGGNAVDNFSFPRTQETRVEIEQTFPWFGKLDLRGKVAENDAAIVHHDHEAMELEIVASVKEAYFDLYATQNAASITRAEEDVLKEVETIAESKYATGSVSQQDVLKAQTETTMLRQQLLDLEQQEATAKAKLNLLLNRPADLPLGLAVTPPVLDVETDTGRLFELAVKARPEIKRAQMDIERNEAQRDLMKKEFYPDYRLGWSTATWREATPTSLVPKIRYWSPSGLTCQFGGRNIARACTRRRRPSNPVRAPSKQQRNKSPMMCRMRISSQ